MVKAPARQHTSGGRDALLQALGRFSEECAVFLTVLHRLAAPGSDRAAEKWKQDYALEGADELALHPLYRAMAWLGAERPAPQQPGTTPSVARTTIRSAANCGQPTWRT